MTIAFSAKIICNRQIATSLMLLVKNSTPSFTSFLAIFPVLKASEKEILLTILANLACDCVILNVKNFAK